MKQRLRYNPATGVWMPAPEARPVQHQFARPRPMTQNRAFMNPIPSMPARPIRPNIRMAVPQAQVAGPNYGRIPVRPTMPHPRFKQLPKNIQEQGKWGQYAITNTLPEPTILPKPNLPNLASYNAAMVKNEQARIEEKIRGRGGGKPFAAQWFASKGIKRSRIRAVDLGRNKTGGSNSRLLNFGSHLGRTLERVF
jgi:hypothetical protein